MYQTSSARVSLSINKSFDYSVPIVFSCKSQSNEHGDRKKESPQLIAPKEEKKVPACTVSSIKNTPVISKKMEEIPKKKEELIKKIEEPAKKSEPLKKESSKKDEIIKNIPAPLKKESEVLPKTNKVYTSSNHREVDAIRCAAQLQKELVTYWYPPLGVSADCFCEISFFVTAKGAIEQLKTVKGSGIMMFDISARQALLNMKMPHWTYNKILSITFKQ